VLRVKWRRGKVSYLSNQNSVLSEITIMMSSVTIAHLTPKCSLIMHTFVNLVKL